MFQPFWGPDSLTIHYLFGVPYGDSHLIRNSGSTPPCGHSKVAPQMPLLWKAQLVESTYQHLKNVRPLVAFCWVAIGRSGCVPIQFFFDLDQIWMFLLKTCWFFIFCHFDAEKWKGCSGFYDVKERLYKIHGP